MKHSNFIVRIPEPCHEDWNTMLPDEKGKFCNSCSKSVFDFSNKTDMEIKNVLVEHRGQNVCGHFKKSQIDRPLNIKVDLNNLPKNLNITKAFVIAVFLVFGTLLFSCTDQKDQKVGEIEVVDHKEKEELILGDMNFGLPQSPSTIIPLEMSSEEMVKGTSTVAECDIGRALGGVSYAEYFIDDVPEPVKEGATVEYVMMGDIAVEYTEIDSVGVADTANNSELKGITTNISNTNVNDFSVYPNPTTGLFTVKYDLKKRSDVRLNIFDISGALVKELVNINSQYEGKYHIPVNLVDLPGGIYMVNLISNGERTTERLVIER